jgi:hypothetical protein
VCAGYADADKDMFNDCASDSDVDDVEEPPLEPEELCRMLIAQYVQNEKLSNVSTANLLKLLCSMGLEVSPSKKCHM